MSTGAPVAIALLHNAIEKEKRASKTGDILRTEPQPCLALEYLCPNNGKFYD